MKVLHPRTFIDNEGIDYTLPFEYDENNSIWGIIEFNDRFIVNFGTPLDSSMRKTNIACIKKQTKEIMWIVQPCFEWDVKKRNQFMWLKADNYNCLRGLVKSNNALSWNVAISLTGHTPKVAYDKANYEFRPEYKNNNLYELKSIKSYPRTIDGELLNEEQKQKYPRGEIERLLAYADLSKYHKEDCLVVASSNIYWYELDIDTGDVTPAYVNVMIEK